MKEEKDEQHSHHQVKNMGISETKKGEREND